MKFVAIFIMFLFYLLQNADLYPLIEKFGLPTFFAVAMYFVFARSDRQKVELMQENNEFLKSLVANQKCKFEK